MIQPAHVLPSNAPPLREGADNQSVSRVLQEHSGNLQQTDFHFGNDHEQKYPSTLLTENNYQYHYQPQPQPQQYQQHHYGHLYHPRPQHRAAALRYGYARGDGRYLTPAEEAKIRLEADRLYQRFRKSDQYIKYRQRQAKDDKGNEDQKWPDPVERAFFRALVQHPPMGRRKSMHKGKQHGRNELIADCIKALTGEDRTRKQVSSHIQVLKPFVVEDPLIMRYLSKEDLCPPGSRFHASSSVYNSGRRMSNYPVTEPPHTARTMMPTLTRPDPYGMHRLKGISEVFEPNDFQMFVQRKLDQEETQRLHTYTQSIPNHPQNDLHIPDWQTIHRDFPLLGAMHAQRPLDCNVLVAEASLAFPTETWKEKDGSPVPGVELGIYFLCSSNHFPPTTGPAVLKDPQKLIVNNTFYENGAHVKEHSGASEINRWEPSERGPGVDTQIKFGSQFWARTLGRLATRLLDKSKDQRLDVHDHLRRITAVQEVFTSNEQGLERLLVMHWMFRLSNNKTGRTSWKKLILPSQSIDQAKTERVDSVYDYGTQFTDSQLSEHPQPQQPTLQSPFEYESGSASALSSSTWPTTIRDSSLGVPQSATTDFSFDNAFDFNAGSINIAYDPSLNFDTFDSSTFNFDTSADFAADPALQDFSQPWSDSFANGFDSQPGVMEEASYTTQPEFDTHTQAYPDYENQYESHSFVDTYDSQGFVGSQDHQAYGGAGQDALKDDPLATLADASYMASAMSLKQEQV